MRVVVLGAGVAGESFVAALHRQAPDADVTVVERELVGGECSYWACIPSKTLLRPVEIVHRAMVAPGAREAVGSVDPENVFAWRDTVAEQDDTSQVEFVRKQGAEVVRGEGVVAEPGLVRVGDRELPYDHLVVATGSSAAAPPIEGLDDVEHWTSREATTSHEVPKRLVIVGGGAVGCELSQFYARIGSKVTLVQGGKTLLDRIDPEAGELLARVLGEEGVDVRVETRPSAVESGGGRIRLTCEGASEAIEGTQLLVATGRRPNTEGFGLEQLPVTLAKTGVKVDDRLRAADGVWAIGDVSGVSLFTHVGKYQGRIAAANVAGNDRKADYRAIPASVFTDPQVASAGDTSGKGAVTSSYSIEKVSRASTYAQPKRPGFVKLFASRERGVLVGAVCVGPEAGEWLGQLTLAIRAEVPVEVLRDSIQPFPTFSEAIFFAARDLDV
jgi:pyruvate/2-oxoglutarate dehydrogenase complex dihydrolipoamide dehydrogenase (E3) component